MKLLDNLQRRLGRFAYLYPDFAILLFFWHDIYLRMKSGRRRMTGQAAEIKAAHTPRHVCAICGATSLSDPKMSFRYCSKCAGGACYCAAHIQSHQHLAENRE